MRLQRVATIHTEEASRLFFARIMETEKVVQEKEEELESKNVKIEELSAAIKVLLDSREKEREKLEETILINVRNLIRPVLQKLREGDLDTEHKEHLDILESSLNDIVSPFLHRLSEKNSGLTRAECMVVRFVREGKRSKEIAGIMNLSERSVETYRARLRRKLGITGKGVNLRSYLLSVE